MSDRVDKDIPERRRARTEVPAVWPRSARVPYVPLLEDLTDGGKDDPRASPPPVERPAKL